MVVPGIGCFAVVMPMPRSNPLGGLALRLRSRLRTRNGPRSPAPGPFGTVGGLAAVTARPQDPRRGRRALALQRDDVLAQRVARDWLPAIPRHRCRVLAEGCRVVPEVLGGDELIELLEDCLLFAQDGEIGID